MTSARLPLAVMALLDAFRRVLAGGNRDVRARVGKGHGDSFADADGTASDQRDVSRQRRSVAGGLMIERGHANSSLAY